MSYKKDPRVDAYIKNATPFARPILKHLRELIVTTCPDVEEGIKWSFPNYSYAGSILCGFASFKEHCSLGFWKASLMKDPSLTMNAKSEVAMGHLGKITSLEMLPPDKKIIAWIKEAMALNEAGIKPVKPKKSTPKKTVIPAYLAASLKKSKKAEAHFESFSPSGKKEYIDWLEEAKTEPTRNKRLEQAMEWIEQGLPRNWKYMKQYQHLL